MSTTKVLGLQRRSGLQPDAVDLLAGLGPGSHRLIVYTTVFGDPGRTFHSAISQPSFQSASTVPEPGSLGSMLAGLGLLLAVRRSSLSRSIGPIPRAAD